MSTRNVYHIVPRDGRWASRLQGSPTVSVESDSRDGVWKETEAIVRRLGSGRIVLHGDDGGIESVHNFEEVLAGPPTGWAQTLRSAPVLVGVAAACLIGLGFALRGRE